MLNFLDSDEGASSLFQGEFGESNELLLAAIYLIFCSHPRMTLRSAKYIRTRALVLGEEKSINIHVISFLAFGTRSHDDLRLCVFSD